jgi:hypothetical protein
VAAGFMALNPVVFPAWSSSVKVVLSAQDSPLLRGLRPKKKNSRLPKDQILMIQVIGKYNLSKNDNLELAIF